MRRPCVPDDDGDGDVEDGEVCGGPSQFGVSGGETEHNGSVSQSSTAGGDRTWMQSVTGGGGCSPRAGGAGSDGGGAGADNDGTSPDVGGAALVGGGAYTYDSSTRRDGGIRLSCLRWSLGGDGLAGDWQRPFTYKEQ